MLLLTNMPEVVAARRRLVFGIGRINAQHRLQTRMMPEKTAKPPFQPSRSNRKRDSGPKVIEPIPLPAVAIPKVKQKRGWATSEMVIGVTHGDRTIFFEIVSDHH